MSKVTIDREWVADEGVIFARFVSSEGGHMFCLSACYSSSEKRYLISRWQVRTRIGNKPLGQSAYKTEHLEDDFKQAYAIMQDKLNGSRPKTVANSTQAELFKASEVVSSKPKTKQLV